MVNPKKPEGVEFSIEDCIAVLENIKGRAKHYDEMYPHFPKEYCEELAGMDCLVIDTVISVLRKTKKELAIANSIEVLTHLSSILRKDGSVDECFGGWLSYYPSIKNPSFAVRYEYASELKFVMEYLADEREEAEKVLNVADSIDILADLSTAQKGKK